MPLGNSQISHLTTRIEDTGYLFAPEDSRRCTWGSHRSATQDPPVKNAFKSLQSDLLLDVLNVRGRGRQGDPALDRGLRSRRRRNMPSLCPTLELLDVPNQSVLTGQIPSKRFFESLVFWSEEKTNTTKTQIQCMKTTLYCIYNLLITVIYIPTNIRAFNLEPLWEVL